MADKINETKEYYDKRFGELSQNLNEEESVRWRAIEALLKKKLDGSKIKIADFGCGRGWLSSKLSTFGEVTGFDVSEKAVENAKQSFPNLKFVCLDASADIHHEFLKNFDLLVSSEVIEHIEDQTSYAKNIFSLLKPNGSFLITTPNGNWKEDFYKDGREAWKQPIENWLKSTALVKLFKDAGFSDLEYSTFSSEWIFNYRPDIKIKTLSNPILRKALKVFGMYKSTILRLNKKHYGLNSILFGSRK